MDGRCSSPGRQVHASKLTIIRFLVCCTLVNEPSQWDISDVSKQSSQGLGVNVSTGIQNISDTLPAYSSHGDLSAGFITIPLPRGAALNLPYVPPESLDLDEANFGPSPPRNAAPVPEQPRTVVSEENNGYFMPETFGIQTSLGFASASGGVTNGQSSNTDVSVESHVSLAAQSGVTPVSTIQGVTRPELLQDMRDVQVYMTNKTAAEGMGTMSSGSGTDSTVNCTVMDQPRISQPDVVPTKLSTVTDAIMASCHEGHLHPPVTTNVEHSTDLGGRDINGIPPVTTEQSRLAEQSDTGQMEQRVYHQTPTTDAQSLNHTEGAQVETLPVHTMDSPSVQSQVMCEENEKVHELDLSNAQSQVMEQEKEDLCNMDLPCVPGQVTQERNQVLQTTEPSCTGSQAVQAENQIVFGIGAPSSCEQRPIETENVPDSLAKAAYSNMDVAPGSICLTDPNSCPPAANVNSATVPKDADESAYTGSVHHDISELAKAKQQLPQSVAVMGSQSDETPSLAFRDNMQDLLLVRDKAVSDPAQPESTTLAEPKFQGVDSCVNTADNCQDLSENVVPTGLPHMSNADNASAVTSGTWTKTAARPSSTEDTACARVPTTPPSQNDGASGLNSETGEYVHGQLDCDNGVVDTADLGPCEVEGILDQIVNGAISTGEGSQVAVTERRCSVGSTEKFLVGAITSPVITTPMEDTGFSKVPGYTSELNAMVEVEEPPGGGSMPYQAAGAPKIGTFASGGGGHTQDNVSSLTPLQASSLISTMPGPGLPMAQSTGISTGDREPSPQPAPGLGARPKEISVSRQPKKNRPNSLLGLSTPDIGNLKPQEYGSMDSVGISAGASSDLHLHSQDTIHTTNLPPLHKQQLNMQLQQETTTVDTTQQVPGGPVGSVALDNVAQSAPGSAVPGLLSGHSSFIPQSDGSFGGQNLAPALSLQSSVGGPPVSVPPGSLGLPTVVSDPPPGAPIGQQPLMTDQSIPVTHMQEQQQPPVHRRPNSLNLPSRQEFQPTASPTTDIEGVMIASPSIYDQYAPGEMTVTPPGMLCSDN